MVFYKVEGILENVNAEAEDSRRAHRENSRRIFMKSVEFNEEHNQEVFCFVSSITDDLLTGGMIAENADKVRSNMQAYLDCIECQLKDATLTEITLNNLQQLLGRSDRNGYIDDAGEVTEEYGIDKVTGRRGRGIEFGENIIADSNRDNVFKNAQKYFLDETMLPELERIYAAAPKQKVYGHPVHYMLQTDNLDTRREASRLLLQALYANGRLGSKRYCFLNFRPGQDFSMMAFDGLYKMCNGGAVVIRYFADDEDEGAVASTERDTIERICEVVKRYRNQVLTIFCLPRECKNAKDMFFENLSSMTMVEIKEDYSDNAQAQEYLKGLAKENHIRTDKALFAKLEPDKGYLAVELNSIFDEWYNGKLKTTVYPQYKDLQVIKKDVVKAAPKGSAYDQLQEMVGLTEAKAVIRKALNYYKMQKLYEEKGVKRDSPAMHMVFTGNPGTAKTTAARLFAQIMKDNGLLSKGQLVEVGRGDLVGRYVGWTAQTVQSKFKEAKGGVLFIDEAYSLVEHHRGSFGDEAINTIVQEMENHREDVVVIFAGYPNEMEKFLQQNPGLRSRVAFHVPFADYNVEELCQIAQLMSKNKGMQLEADAVEKLGLVFTMARQQNDFGNGRYVRNILEQARMNQASRLLEYDFEAITADEIKTLKAVDIVVPEVKTEAARTIGFAC